MLGQNAAPAILDVNTFTSYTSSDYNGFRPNPGAKASFAWNSPPRGTRRGLHRAWPQRRPREPRVSRRSADYSKATGQDAHSVAVDYDVFVERAEARRARYAERAEALQSAPTSTSASSPDRRPSIAASPLPTVTDGFAGSAPDLGALEAGKPVPHYGPR